MPEIGHPEAYYARIAKHADKTGMIHAHEAAKVGQYVTLAMDPNLDWETKRRYFRHVLRRHCVRPAVADDLVSMYYQRLRALVMQYAGQEALRLACAKDDEFAMRLREGESRAMIAVDAAEFFGDLLGHEDHCPSYYSEEDWAQLRMIRNQWIPPEQMPNEAY
jgi:hypothetical protein